MYFLRSDKRVGKIYFIIFVLGVFILISQRNVFTWEGFLSGFPIAAILAGSYFWIRLDIWRTDDTINKQSGNNDLIKTDLIHRRVDCRVALGLLVAAAMAQAFLLKNLIFIGVLLVLVPLANECTCLIRKLKDIKKMGK